MISVQEAKKIIWENVSTLLPVTLPLQEAAGLTLAEDVYATTTIPAFPQSSMDGYAFAYDDWQNNIPIKIIGEVAAGTKMAFNLETGQAVRIFTGAAVPAGADIVVMQEKAKTEDGILIIDDEKMQRGNNVRPKGSEINAGELALKNETLLSPAAIGFLAGIGMTDAKVYPNPTISIIITGNELQQPGKPLPYGQVYESNSFALIAVLKQLNINHTEVYYADDKQEIVINTLKKALEHSDVVLLTGGISVGDYDFVLQAANECGVEKLFHKIKQRPGKPLYFGKKACPNDKVGRENKLVFGLPGNPSSVLTCFYQYVIPSIEKLSLKKTMLPSFEVPLSGYFQKNTGLTHFLKGNYDGKTVSILDAQESYRLSSFARANCLIQINEEVTECKEADLVTVYLLPK